MVEAPSSRPVKIANQSTYAGFNSRSAFGGIQATRVTSEQAGKGLRADHAPGVGFWEIAIYVPEARFWIVSGLPTRTKPLARRTLRRWA